jgi:cation diffusion facilitator family transporter
MAYNHQDNNLTPQKVAAARLSIYSNSLLTILKLAVGLFTGSVSVLSEAVHSASDLMASFIAFFSVSVSDKPADEVHPYGHGKIESLSGLAEAFLIVFAGAYIVYESIEKLYHKSAAPQVDLGISVMAFSVILNSIVARYLYRVAETTDSLALRADAEHLKTDIFTSLGVFAGLLLVRFTGWNPMDPIAAIVVALLIFRASWKLARTSVEPLVDTQLPEEEIQVVRNALELEPAVMGFHKLRTRKSGSMRHVDAHILLDDDLSLIAAHDLTEKIEDRIREALPNTEITLHTEPFRTERRHQHEEHGGPEPEE